MRGRTPYVMILGYISPTLIKILVDHAISQTVCMSIYFFAASIYVEIARLYSKEDLGTRLPDTC